MVFIPGSALDRAVALGSHALMDDTNWLVGAVLFVTWLTRFEAYTVIHSSAQPTAPLGGPGSLSG